MLIPTLAPDAWTVGEMRRLLLDVHATIDPLVPWHHRRTGNEDFDPRARLVLPQDAQVLLI